MIPRFSVRYAIAAHLNEDIAEIERRRYQETRCACPVYEVGDEYLTATSSQKRHPPAGETRGGYNAWNWRRIDSRASDIYGWQIWRHVEPEEVG